MNNGCKENNVSYHYKLFSRLFVLPAMSSVTVCIKKTCEYRCKENVSYKCCSTVRTVHRPAMSSVTVYKEDVHVNNYGCKENNVSYHYKFFV